MAQISRYIALLLLTLWLPATLHCDLQAAGVAESPDCCTDGHSCAGDEGCNVVVNALCKPGNDVIKVPAPALTRDSFGSVELHYFFSSLMMPRLIVAPKSGSFERPLDWVTTWQFVRRAAPPCRAPAPFCA